MDAKERLRLYLEQRRELGEYDLVLDKLPVADVLALLGARDVKVSAKKVAQAPQAPQAPVGDVPESAAAAPTVVNAPPPPQARFDTSAPASKDWRAALRASGADGAAPAKRVSEPAPTSSRAETGAPADAAPPGPGDVTREGIPVPAWLTALDVPLGLSVGGAGGRPASNTASDTAARPTSLDEIAESVAHCTACALYASATRHVPGEGDPNADFMCVGEAPGQHEDEQGRPFVGPAGELLMKILGAIDLTRERVFICNVLKHRPPANRNPLPAEVHACRPFLEQQLALVRPRVILALGTFAAQTLLDTTQPLGTLRGQIHRYHGVPLIVTYHPAALLRNEAWKRPTWQDVQLARRIHDASRLANPS